MTSESNNLTRVVCLRGCFYSVRGALEKPEVNEGMKLDVLRVGRKAEVTKIKAQSRK